MPYEVLIGPEGFGGLRGAWEALESRCATHVFQTYDFANAWLETAGAATRSTPLIVTYETGARTVGIFPACLTHYGPLRLTTWLAGPHVLDYGDVIFDPLEADISASEFVTGALMALRPHSRLAPLYLTNVRDDAAAFAPLTDIARRHKSSTAPFVDTTGDFEAFTASLSREVRKKIRHRNNELRRKGEVTFSVLHAGEDGYEDTVRRILELKLARYRTIDHSSGVFTPGWQEFRLKQALTDPTALVALLTVGGEFGAAQIMCAFNRRLYLLVSAFAPELAHASPGFVLDHNSIRYAFEHDFDVCDFCWGNEPHKYLWTDVDQHLTTFVSDDATGRALSAAATLRRRVGSGNRG